MTASTASTGLGSRGEEISATGEWTPELEQWLRERAAEAGFDTAGVAPVNATGSAAGSGGGLGSEGDETLGVGDEEPASVLADDTLCPDAGSPTDGPPERIGGGTVRSLKQ